MNAQDDLRATARILVAANVSADGELAAATLRKEFKQVAVVFGAEAGRAAVEARPPDVLVLAVRPLQAAEQHFAALVGERAPDCRTVVLCQSTEVSSAYERCAAGTYHDYMQFWPMTFDTPRLPMSVWSALRDRRRDRLPSLLELATRSLRAAEVDPFLVESLVELHALVDSEAALAQWVAGFERRCQPHLHSIRALREQAELAMPARPTVLVVEDDAFQQKLLQRMLVQEGVNFLVVGDGAAALAAVAQRIPEMILLDIGLPGIDGIEVLRRLKAAPATAQVPTVMLSGNSDKHSVVESMRLGADDFIVKPVTADKLRDKLQRLAARGAADGAPPA